ncbi:MAG TPA: ABC transporter ATP-binding protein [Candidatus Baltobacteraceae bacterium]
MPIFAIKNLTKSFGNTWAVDDLSFSVEGGEIVGLLGPNGAGKSTTFMSACGLLRPDHGTFEWAGQVLGPERGRTVSLIPESPEVYPMLTVWEHLTFVAKSCRLGAGWESRASALLERFGMLDSRDVLGQGLSKGMKQKTLIAATVLAGTPVLLFDEPMIGLDPLGQRELRDLFVALKAEGKAIVISTHALESAQAICDRVVIVKNGKAIAAGTFAELEARSGEHGTAEDIFLELTR